MLFFHSSRASQKQILLKDKWESAENAFNENLYHRSKHSPNACTPGATTPHKVAALGIAALQTHYWST